MLLSVIIDLFLSFSPSHMYCHSTSRWNATDTSITFNVVLTTDITNSGLSTSNERLTQTFLTNCMSLVHKFQYVMNFVYLSMHYDVHVHRNVRSLLLPIVAFFCIQNLFSTNPHNLKYSALYAVPFDNDLQSTNFFFDLKINYKANVNYYL